jgi:hypothetical protein
MIFGSTEQIEEEKNRRLIASCSKRMCHYPCLLCAPVAPHPPCGPAVRIPMLPCCCHIGLCREPALRSLATATSHAALPLGCRHVACPCRSVMPLLTWIVACGRTGSLVPGTSFKVPREGELTAPNDQNRPDGQRT